MIDANTLSRLKELLGKATEGPWIHSCDMLRYQIDDEYHNIATFWNKDEDVELVKELRNAAPDLIEAAERADRLEEYAAHADDCILSFLRAGRPTSDGGYETNYAGKWYQSKPVDKTPKCNCGLDELFSPKG